MSCQPAFGLNVRSTYAPELNVIVFELVRVPEAAGEVVAQSIVPPPAGVIVMVQVMVAAGTLAVRSKVNAARVARTILVVRLFMVPFGLAADR